ncbi:MAG: DUF1295 domain-containing protein [Myxococcota bacterium]|jgi:protein-S-isoprenylcysteine O-methyltransferase Ste14|nr:DUF1295 domain-containing protein [Myxococcota bacterium]
MLSTEAGVHEVLSYLVFGLGALTLLALFFVSAPYGRHLRDGWGPTIPSRLGWIVMESPSALGFIAIFAMGKASLQLVPLLLLGMWQLHYLHRTFIFPFRMRAKGRRMPLSIAAMAIVFNCLNSYVNARWLSHLGDYPDSLLHAPHLYLGLALFVTGFIINVHADSLLFRLRAPGETGYKIPRGGLYRWLSSPNYFGEMLEWVGFAIAAWSLPAWAFAFYTFANLFPRALSNHRWYQEKFADYPSERKAVIPFLL